MHDGMYVVLVINPGSTSTKLAVYHDSRPIFNHTISYTSDFLIPYSHIWDQFDFRLESIRTWIHSQAIKADAVAAIGGLLKPVSGGAYRVNEQMLADARSNYQGAHPSNLGCALAHEIAREFGCEAYIVDPVSVDEFEPLARYSGHPLIERRSLSHALNIHATARKAAEEFNRSLEQTSFIIAHLGGGISIAPVRGGRIIDVNDASSDGPFSPNRTGGLPLQPFISLCFTGKYNKDDLRTMVMGKGGLIAYLGTASAEEIEKRITGGDTQAEEIYEAMAYQIAKEIGAMATVLHGNIHAIVLTGGLAGSDLLTRWITERVKFIADVKIYPGENEMDALASAVDRILNGTEMIKEYK
jgi:butyrate kinase